MKNAEVSLRERAHSVSRREALTECLLFTARGMGGKALMPPEPRCLHLLSGTNSRICLLGLLWGANEIICQLAFHKLQKQVQLVLLPKKTEGGVYDFSH